MVVEVVVVIIEVVVVVAAATFKQVRVICSFRPVAQIRRRVGKESQSVDCALRSALARCERACLCLLCTFYEVLLRSPI